MLRLWIVCVQRVTVQGSRSGACGLWVVFQKASLQAVAAMTLCERLVSGMSSLVPMDLRAAERKEGTDGGFSGTGDLNPPDCGEGQDY